MVRQLSVTDEQYKVITLALSSVTVDLQEKLVTKNYSDDYILETVHKLKNIDRIHSEFIREWQKQGKLDG